MSANTVHVSNIAAKTDDKEIRDFFSFCGKITDIKVTTEGTTKSAVVTFEKSSASKTALLLNHTKLGEHEITVTSEHSSTDDDGAYKPQGERDSDEITQEEKPRSRILAEYLAHGYVVADAGLQSAIALDEKHGVSARFLNTLQGLDAKYHATDRAKTADQSYGITERASNLWNGLGSYLESAANTVPGGQRFAKFYTNSSRQVADIHSEAKRLADLKKQEAGGSSYKAAGLHKVFGEEKSPATGSTSGASAPGAAPSHAAATESATKPTAPSTAHPDEKPAQVPHPGTVL